MQQQRKKYSIIVFPFVIVFFILSLIIALVYSNGVFARAEDNGDADDKPVILKDEKNIDIKSYRLEDNSGYYESPDKRGHVLNNKLINLSVCAQSELSQPEIQKGNVSGYQAYGVTGQSVAIRLSYNYRDPDNLLNASNGKWSISNDTFQSVGEFKDIGVIGKGAMLFQKKTDPNGPWEWQTKDGETKKQLHTFNFTELVELNDYYKTEDKYILYTPSGNDLSTGVYIKIIFAYELKHTDIVREKNFWGIWKDVTYTHYENILETAEFYIVQNSGAVLFHNASNFGQIGEESESGAFSVNDFDTILDGDVTLNGFRLDTLGVSAYDITYRRNGEAESHTATDGEFFLEQGRYDFSIKTKLGKNIRHTIFIDRREVNDAAIGYFGQTLFTKDSKRIYSTRQYPTYLAGAKYHLNATDGTVSPIAGKLYRITENDEAVEEHFIKDIVPTRLNGYATEELSVPITKAGLYKAEFWNNTKCLSDNNDLSGDVFHFVFRFQIVETSAGVEPSINQAYLNGLIGFSDLKSKYFAVSTPTKGIGNAIFAFADYGSAYDFAYELERETVKHIDNEYLYNGETYKTQNDVLKAIDSTTKNRVTVRYFDATNPESYQTADISSAKLSDLNFDRDIIVFTNDLEQNYLKVDLPFLNDRKFRYVMPANAETGASSVNEGVLPFAFIKTDDFETQSITLVLADDPNIKYDISYGVSVEYQLGLLNAPSGKYKVIERNANKGDSEYEAVYIKSGDMTSSVKVSLYSDGEFTEHIFNANNLDTVRDVSGFIINSVTNELDPYGIVKVTHDGKTEIYSMSEISDKLYADGGAYDFNIVDRLGNEMRFTIVITRPVGFASVKLQLDDNIDDIQTEYNVFVGQEIDLPIIPATSELHVFDGWLYDDVLITDGKFAPTKSGDIYIWAQFTQKYTYLNFDSNGGAPVEQIKAEIGKELALPATTKDGWRFGGWQYGGKVYNDSYSPTTSSPTFVAVWNYIKTDIELYDGNLFDTITANVGDKVILPFPTRTGYTFFGWRLDLGNGQNKIYYGQITKLENVDAMRLDALWIHNSDVDSASLDQGDGGRTAIYFIDGTLFEDDTIVASVGTNIALPTPTRAGYTFVGWTWRTTPIAGKIYVGKTMTVPQNADGKIVLEALWTARAVNSGAYVPGSINKDGSGSGLLAGITDFIARKPVAFICLIFSAVVAAMISVKLTKKKVMFAPVKQAVNATYSAVIDTPVTSNCDLTARQSEYRTTINKQQRRKAFIAGFRLNPLSVTVCVALFMTVIMALTGVLGSWGRSTVVTAETVQVVTFDQSQTVEDEETERDLGGNFSVDDYIYPQEKNESEICYSQEEITDYKENIEQSRQTGLEITDDEAFLYSIIILDMFSFGYNAFPATATLHDGRVLYGIAYSDYGTECLHEDTNITYIGAGFIAACGQPEITEDLIKQGIVIKSSNNETDSSGNLFMLTQADSYGPKHYVADNKYIVYSVDGTQIHYSVAEATEENYNAEIGAVYSYDEGRIVYDPLLGTFANAHATSLNTLLDPVIAENEYNRYIAEQTANGFTVDTMNFVYISRAALEAYCLNGQDESLLGIDVQEFYDMERTVGPNEYYTVDADGNLTKLNFPPKEDESKGSWLDRLFGAIISVGMIVVGVVIVATVSVISCGAATAAAPYIMGAFIGAGMEVFMQTVIQGKPIDEINWLRVGVAAVSGVLSAIPGVGWFGAGMIQGVTEAAMTAVDGGSLEDVFKAFAVGFITGVVIHGVGKALKKVKFCFTAGTPVLMAAGYTKSIENIRPGDVVESYNQITCKAESKRVLQTFENETDEITKITTSAGDTINSTPGHKFYANGKWLSAQDLRAGDILVNVNGEQVIVEQVQHEILENPIKIYNFEVADNNSYYVGGREAGVLVHNAKCSNKFDNTEIIVDGKKVEYKDLGKTLDGKKYAYKIEGTHKGYDVAYVGKGTNGRVKVSMKQRFNCADNDIKRVVIKTVKSDEKAFKLEAKWMNQYAKKEVNLLNEIASPGFSIGVKKNGNLYKYLFRFWGKK